MREKQLILIPKDSKYKSKNMLWSQTLLYFDIDDDRLRRLIENGKEINGYYIDEALIYDNKL